ncbi:MAG: hypothetical protein U0168_14260 [Nannocystaceae bacterium]
MNRAHLIELAVTIALASCTVHESAAPAEPAADEPTATPPAVATAGAPTPSRAAPATAPAIFRTALPHAKSTHGFERAATFATLEGRVQLARLADDVLAAFGGPEVVILEADGRVTADPQWTRGIESHSPELLDGNMLYWYPVALGGRWPEGTYLTVGLGSAARSGGGPPQVYGRRQGRWHRVATRTRRLDWYPVAYGPWKDGSLLALKHFEPRFSTDGEGDVEPPAAEVRAFEAELKKQKRLVVIAGAPKAPTLPVQDIRAFASLPSGELFVAARERDRTVMVHHDGTSARRVELPGASDGVVIEGLRALAPDRVFAWGSAAENERGYLARYDGASWHPIADLPCSGGIGGLDVDREGTLYFVCDVPSNGKSGNSALLRLRGDVLEEIGVPSDPDEGPLAVLARGPDDVWVVTGRWGDSGDTLWHTGVSGEPVALRGSVETNALLLEWNDPEPIGPQCWIAWVPLRSGADPDKASAAVRAQSEVVAELRHVRIRGTEQWGVWVSESPKRMRTALARVAKALGGDAGEPSCNEWPWVDPPDL